MTSPQTPSGGDGPQGSAAQRALRMFLSLHLPAISLGLGLGIAQPVLPVIARDQFGVGVEVASLVFIVYLAGTAAAPLPTGIIIDRVGRRKVLLLGPLVVALAAALTAKAAFSGSFTELLVYRFIAGWGEQMWLLSRLAIIADTGASQQRGKQVTSMFGVQQAGNFLGPVIGGVAAVAWGLWTPFVIQAVVTVAAIIPSFYIVKETSPVGNAVRGGGRPATDGNPGSWKTLLAHPIPMVLFVQFLANITRGGVYAGGVLFLYGAYAYDAGADELGYLRGAMALVGIPMTFAIGFVMDRWGRKVTIVPGLFMSGATMLFMAFTAFASLPFTAFIAAFVAVHLGINMISGNMQTLGSDVAPPGARGRFFGVSRLTSQTGAFVSPSSFAVLSGMAGFGPAFAFLSSTALIGSMLVAFFIRETLERAPKSRPNETTTAGRET